MTKLSKLATELLTKHKTQPAAAAALAKALAQDEALRLEIALDYLGRVATAKLPHSRRREGPHRKPSPGTPTTSQKKGAIAAMRQYTDEVFKHKLRGGKMLGAVRVNELRTIAEASAQTASSFLGRGYDDAVETFLCVGLSNHCVAADPFSLVSDVIKGSTARAILSQSRMKAAELIRDGGAKIARDILAAAHEQEAIGAS